MFTSPRTWWRQRQHRGYGATVARLTPDQKVGSSNLSALIFMFPWPVSENLTLDQAADTVNTFALRREVSVSVSTTWVL